MRMYMNAKGSECAIIPRFLFRAAIPFCSGQKSPEQNMDYMKCYIMGDGAVVLATNRYAAVKISLHTNNQRPLASFLLHHKSPILEPREKGRDRIIINTDKITAADIDNEDDYVNLTPSSWRFPDVYGLIWRAHSGATHYGQTLPAWGIDPNLVALAAESLNEIPFNRIVIDDSPSEEPIKPFIRWSFPPDNIFPIHLSLLNRRFSVDWEAIIMPIKFGYILSQLEEPINDPMFKSAD